MQGLKFSFNLATRYAVRSEQFMRAWKVAFSLATPYAVRVRGRNSYVNRMQCFLSLYC